MNRTAPLLVALLVGCPSGSDGNKDTSGDDGGGGGGARGGLPSHAVATVDVTACGGSVPQARSFHHAAWFFLTTPVQVTAGRWVERGFVVTGGWSEASGALLNDLWLFDLTNAGASDCPWVNLGTSGPGAASGSLSWDPTRQRLLYAGGFSEGSTAEYTSDGVYTATIQELVDGLGWTSRGALPTREVTTSSLGDGTAFAEPWPLLDCSPVAREAPCAWGGITLSDLIDYVQSGGACGPGGLEPGDYVTEWGVTAPSWAKVDCDSGLSPANTWYIDACADDPYVLNPGEEAWMAYDAAAAPGVAEAATAFDPVAGRAWLHGGTTGCTGSCTDWTDVGNLDLSGRDGLHLANDDTLLQIDDTTATDEGRVRAGAVADTVVPPDTSYGRRAAAGAWVGVDWDFPSGAYTGVGWMAAVGGTRHHELGLGRQHEMLCEDESGDEMNLCGYCAESSDTWVAGEPAYTSTGDGLVSGAMVLSVLDPGGAWSGQGDVGARVYAAASWFGGHEVLVWGGSGTTGARSDLFAWDTQGGGATGSATVYAATEPWGAREGGTAIYDPITRTAYLFGGANDSAVYTFARDAAGTAVALSSLDNADVQQGIEVGATVEPEVNATLTTADGVDWSLASGWEIEVDCVVGTDCFVDTLSMYVATEAPAELDTLTVTVTYDDHGDSYTLEPFAKTLTGTGDTLVQVRLPRVLADEGGLDVIVEWSGTTREFDGWKESIENTRANAALGSYLLGSDDASTPEDDRPAFVVLTDAPVIPGGLEGGGFRHVTTFTLPAGWQGVGAGMPDAAFTSYEAPIYPHRNAVDVPSVASSALVLDRTMTTSLGASVYLWRDSGISLAPSAHSDYLTATAGDDRPEADLAWMEAVIRPFQAESFQMVMVRRSSSEEAAAVAPRSLGAGTAFPGLVWLMGADVGGVPISYTRPTLVHELAHELFLWRNLPEGQGVIGTRWWSEGTASLIESMRTGGPGPFSTAVPALAAATCDDVLDDLELDGRNDTVAYDYGAYTAAQLYWTFVAWGGTPADFWAEVEAMHSTAPTLDAPAIDGFITGQLGLPTFYAEWVAANRVGTPLLSVTDITPDNSACVDTGPCDPTTATVTVTQIQAQQVTRANGCAYDAPLFTDVPWFLQCWTPSSALPAFYECDAGTSWLDGGPPRTVSTASEVVTLSVDATRGAAWPSWFRPLANDDLVPDAVPQSGGFVPGRGAYRVCARPGDADCGGDNDGDGWSMDAECDDADPTRNPGAFPGPLSADPADDNNCDGW